MTTSSPAADARLAGLYVCELSLLLLMNVPRRVTPSALMMCMRAPTEKLPSHSWPGGYDNPIERRSLRIRARLLPYDLTTEPISEHDKRVSG